MAQDLTAKKRAVAAALVQQADALLTAAMAMEELAKEVQQVGSFTDAQLDYSGLTHLTPFLIDVLAGDFKNGLTAALDAVTYVGGPTRRELLLQVRAGG